MPKTSTVAELEPGQYVYISEIGPNGEKKMLTDKVLLVSVGQLIDKHRDAYALTLAVSNSEAEAITGAEKKHRMISLNVFSTPHPIPLPSENGEGDAGR